MIVQPMTPLVGAHATWPPNLAPKNFAQRKMVDWLGPLQLVRAGMKVAVSGVFGEYADKRTVMAALDRDPKIYDYSHEKDLWVDYVADLGDGFDSTYSIARLLTAPRLTLAPDVQTNRGRILIMGGDQVYPTASYDEYLHRTILPYRAAMAAVGPDEVTPDLFAIPGNHDWYDGLASFQRVFCQGRWFAGWNTHQRRSYFAIKLPYDWWLWGFDTQLGGDIDEPQLEFFEDVARNHVAPGAKMILCSAQPGWVEATMGDPTAFRAQAFFEEHVVRATAHAELKLALSGDLHHYNRYTSADGAVQRITAGGGGAYLYPTHHLPETFDLDVVQTAVAGVPPAPVHYTEGPFFPDRRTSRRLAWGCLRLPLRSWHFTLFLAALYTLYGWFLQSASRALFAPTLVNGLPTMDSLMQRIQGVSPSPGHVGPVARHVMTVLAHSPSCAFFTLFIIVGLIAFCEATGMSRRIAWGTAHGLAHVCVAIAGLWGAAYVNLFLGQLPVDSPSQVLLFCGEMALLGSIAGGLVMAIYLVAASGLGGFHDNELFSSQRIGNYKNFVRLHLKANGQLAIYPIGLRHSVTDWQYKTPETPSDPWFVGGPPNPELIEDAFDVP